MSAAVLTPRVRLMAICDGVRESKTEAGVYHLKGLRQRIAAQVFPFAASRLWCLLVLSCHRPGEYPGYIRVMDDTNDKAIFFAKVVPHPRFEGNEQTWTAVARLRCSFPHTGRYILQVWFYQEQGSDVLKGEQPFSVTNEGD